MFDYKSFDELADELTKMIEQVSKPLEILEIGAKEYVNDLLKLPKPYSKIRSSGYTHLVDTFCYEIRKDEIVVGWGKYYGRMLEDGTKITKRQAHMYPTFEENKEKYYSLMLNKKIY